MSKPPAEGEHDAVKARQTPEEAAQRARTVEAALTGPNR